MSTRTLGAEGGSSHRKLTIVFHHAGGGHRSTADALKDALTSQECPWEVRLLNVQELLAPLDVARRATGLHIEDAYNLILRKGWTRFTPQLLVLLQTTIRAYHSRVVKLLRACWAQHPTDLVLSVIPHFNRALAESLRGNGPRTPFVTLLTDLADYPPRFWIEPESEFVIAGSEQAKRQALAMGHAADCVFQSSGMVLKPQFYQKHAVDRASERKRLGLEPDCLTGIVLFGGHGSRVMIDIVKRLNQSGVAVQLILICGHNAKLAAKLKSLKTRKPMLVEGFTSNVVHYMSLADFFIGKPGPGSISEALQCHLPVIVECNARTLPQERYNAQWVTEMGYGLVVKSFREIAPSVERLLAPSTFEDLRRNAGTYCNRALFEVPVILEQCLNRAAQLAP
ncbi:MAG: galactosyldiacylglycerol synthase [Acidobacteriia bacterium]|nr:galactosyldiacylglycerol synthase [Terriglobia bacterium]